MMMRIHKSDPAYDLGIRAYTGRIHKCPVCGIPTNVLWSTTDGGRILQVACSQACADRAVEMALGLKGGGNHE